MTWISFPDQVSPSATDQEKQDKPETGSPDDISDHSSLLPTNTTRQTAVGNWLTRDLTTALSCLLTFRSKAIYKLKRIEEAEGGEADRRSGRCQGTDSSTLLSQLDRSCLLVVLFAKASDLTTARRRGCGRGEHALLLCDVMHGNNRCCMSVEGCGECAGSAHFQTHDPCIATRMSPTASHSAPGA